MAYFAELDENNIVLRVIAVGNDVLLNEQGEEIEEQGIVFCQSLFNSKWVQTSYNTNANKHLFDKTPFRKNYAGIGYIYDEIKDAFIPPKPEEEFYALDEDKCIWYDPLYTSIEIGVSRV